MKNKDTLDGIKDLPALLRKEQALSPSSRSGRSQFIAALPEIRAALEAGYSLNSIWGFLFKKGVFTSGYGAFTRHVRLRIDSNKKTKIQIKRDISASLVSENSERVPSLFSEPKLTPEELSHPSPTHQKLPKIEPFVPPPRTEKRENQGMQIIKPIEKPSVKFSSIPDLDKLI